MAYGENTFYWHDYETWGERPAFDRPAQFAGIRTDEALNILGDPLMIFAKPASDVLPKPDAVLITGITPQQALEEGLPECEFMARIHQELARPRTCGVGYNSIRFDDEVTRYGLYRNFFDPYEREWKSGNSRWDLIDVVRMMRALRPDGVEWPFYEDGTPCNKLEALSAANNLAHERAHDALSDVYATIGLAKLIKQKQPKLFEYAYRLRDKRFVASLIDVQNYKPLLHTSSRFPSSQLNTSLIVPLLYHPTNRNAVVCFNLRQDPRALLELPVEAIRERLYVAQADLPKGVERIALKEIHLNRSPMLATPALLISDVIKRIDLDVDACSRHASIFQSLTPAEREVLSDKLMRLYAGNELPEADDVDAALYGGFVGDADKSYMYELRRLPPELRARADITFEDARLNALLMRYKGRNFESLLDKQHAVQWATFCLQRLKNGVGDWGFDAFDQRLLALKQGNVTVKEMELLDALQQYRAQLESTLCARV